MEEGTDCIDKLYDYTIKNNQRFYTLRQSITEFGSAAYRLMREKKFTELEASKYLYNFLHESNCMMVLMDADDTIIRISLELVYKYPLKAVDTLHLSCALDLHQRTGSAFFVSDDYKLCGAASSEGLPVLIPTNETALPLIKNF